MTLQALALRAPLSTTPHPGTVHRRDSVQQTVHKEIAVRMPELMVSGQAEPRATLASD